MMVTTTIPDKLSVTSFVYQMYQFFTKARMSAIAKGEKENAGSLGTYVGMNDSTCMFVIGLEVKLHVLYVLYDV